MTAAVAVGALVAAGVFLILRRGLVRITFGFILLSHAVNILLMAAGGLRRRGAPLTEPGGPAPADPLPQAFVLTAIVISFGTTVYLLGLARAERRNNLGERDGGLDEQGGPGNRDGLDNRGGPNDRGDRAGGDGRAGRRDDQESAR